MTPKQQRFVQHYAVTRNATQAAIVAGYAPDKAASSGSKMLRRPVVIAALHDLGVTIVYGAYPPDQLRARRKPFVKKGLTYLQQRFVEEYLLCGNATRAAVRAGLPGRRPEAAGGSMMSRSAVAAAIQEARDASAERTRISVDRVAIELARIGFADLADIVDWGPDGMVLKPRGELSKDDRAALLEVTEQPGAAGPRVRVRVHNKQRALDSLARYLGMYGTGAAVVAKAAAKAKAEADLRQQQKEESVAIIRARLDRMARNGGGDGNAQSLFAVLGKGPKGEDIEEEK
jgi:phage terminase small subunit